MSSEVRELYLCKAHTVVRKGDQPYFVEPGDSLIIRVVILITGWQFAVSITLYCLAGVTGEIVRLKARVRRTIPIFACKRWGPMRFKSDLPGICG